jgi:hypothetical protein
LQAVSAGDREGEGAVTTVRRMLASSSWAEMLAGMSIGVIAATLVQPSAMDTTIAIMLGACIGRWAFGGRRW